MRRWRNISTHAPAWGATSGSNASPLFSFQFLLTPPRGGRSTLPCGMPTPTRFLLTPPHGGDATRARGLPVYCRFLLTPPREGRRSAPGCNRPACWNFYSRPRVGGDILDALNGHAYNDISTHAPAWGATLLSPLRADAQHISTHAPAWGAT